MHIVGGGCDSFIKEYKQCLGTSLISHGWVSREIAFEFMQKTDILINLNNTILNQLLSKIFEYISTGKPVLNVCNTEGCLSLKYTRKYSNCFYVIETQVKNDIVENIKNFVLGKRDVLVDKSIILENFKEHTDEYLAKLVGSDLRKLCEMKDGKK